MPTTQSDPVPTDIGNWESSGILDISTLLGNAPGTVLLYDVQAHSLRDGNIINKPGEDTNGDGTVTRQDNLVEGGQLSLLIAPGAELVQDSTQVFGSNGADDLAAGIDFSGVNDVVFTGSGDDIVDVQIGGATKGFNRINTGSGADWTFVGDGDRLNAGSGDDEIDATDAMGYRLSGGAGDDIFFLGASGRALGGDGDDQFYVQEGGDNILSGGAGSDQFWLLTDGIPTEANIVTDFSQGTDVIGIANQGSVDFTSLGFNGNDIALNGDVFATLIGVETASLSAADFVFA